VPVDRIPGKSGLTQCSESGGSKSSCDPSVVAYRKWLSNEKGCLLFLLSILLNSHENFLNRINNGGGAHPFVVPRRHISDRVRSDCNSSIELRR
jgi:hypothetical protein